MSRLKITVTPELNKNIEILKEYYSEKTKSGAIIRAIKDCATVAEHTNVVYGVDLGTKDGDKGCTVKSRKVNGTIFIDSIKHHNN